MLYLTGKGLENQYMVTAFLKNDQMIIIGILPILPYGISKLIPSTS